MNKIANFNIKIISTIVFIGLIIATHNLIIPKNIIFLFLKFVFLIPSVALLVNVMQILFQKIYYIYFQK